LGRREARIVEKVESSPDQTVTEVALDSGAAVARKEEILGLVNRRERMSTSLCRHRNCFKVMLNLLHACEWRCNVKWRRNKEVGDVKELPLPVKNEPLEQDSLLMLVNRRATPESSARTLSFSFQVTVCRILSFQSGPGQVSSASIPYPHPHQSPPPRKSHTTNHHPPQSQSSNEAQLNNHGRCC
jgi:hypothetical protein